jgi:hypothetical protein
VLARVAERRPGAAVVIAGSDGLITICSQKSAVCDDSVMVLQRDIRYIWRRKIGVANGKRLASRDF